MATSSGATTVASLINKRAGMALGLLKWINYF